MEKSQQAINSGPIAGTRLRCAANAASHVRAAPHRRSFDLAVEVGCGRAVGGFPRQRRDKAPPSAERTRICDRRGDRCLIDERRVCLPRTLADGQLARRRIDHHPHVVPGAFQQCRAGSEAHFAAAPTEHRRRAVAVYLEGQTRAVVAVPREHALPPLRRRRRPDRRHHDQAGIGPGQVKPRYPTPGAEMGRLVSTGVQAIVGMGHFDFAVAGAARIRVAADNAREPRPERHSTGAVDHQPDLVAGPGAPTVYVSQQWMHLVPRGRFRLALCQQERSGCRP